MHWTTSHQDLSTKLYFCCFLSPYPTDVEMCAFNPAVISQNDFNLTFLTEEQIPTLYCLFCKVIDWK